MNLNQAEAAALEFVANELEANKAEIEPEGAKIGVAIVNGALYIEEQAFAKLPFGMGGLIDQAFKAYASKVEANLPQYVGQGVDGAAAYLKAVAARLLGN